MAMRTLNYSRLSQTSKTAITAAYLRGELTERKRLRTMPRDPEKSKFLARIASARIRKHPIRKNKDGTYYIFCVSEN